MLLVLAMTCGASPIFAASALNAPNAEPLAFKANGSRDLSFDTGVVKGTLTRDGLGEALKGITFIDGNLTIDKNHGLLMPYRFLTPERRYGFGSWEWPRTGKILENGAAQLLWAAAPDRPFAFSTVYRWKSADTLDLTVFFAPQTNLNKFELFLGSYFEKFTSAKAYVQDAGNDAPGFVEAARDKGEMQLFPISSEVLPIVNDGRWNFPPYPNNWAIRSVLAKPLGMKIEPMSRVTVLLMAPPEDCFALSTCQQSSPLGAFYLSLFGKDIQRGQTLIGHARLVFGKNITDSQAVARYAEYLKDVRSIRDNSLLTPAEMGAMRKVFAATPTGVEAMSSGTKPPDWISPEVPGPEADGWVVLFDGRHLYGCSPSAADIESGKVRLQDGALWLDSCGLAFNVAGRDVAIRALLRKVTGQNCSLSVRNGAGRARLAWFNGGDFFGIGKVDNHRYENLATVHAPGSYKDFIETEFRAEGGQLTLNAEGKTVCTARDDSVLEGTTGVQALKGITLFKSLKVRVLGQH
jgi:hypothetical protein